MTEGVNRTEDHSQLSRGRIIIRTSSNAYFSKTVSSDFVILKWKDDETLIEQNKRRCEYNDRLTENQTIFECNPKANFLLRLK